jgi:hypothetical protein
MTALTEWQNFYVIAGSSAGALIGLQFVVLALIASSLRSPETAQAGAVFASPAIVHFTTVLVLAGTLCAPWPSLPAVAIALGTLALAGVAYSVQITLRMRRLSVYKPEFEDWLFHAVLPLAAYSGLIAAACLVSHQARPALFGVAASTLLLLLIGIHNAWDTVTYHVFTKAANREEN